MRKLKHCYSIADLRRVAQQSVPSPFFHYVDGAADDEWSLNHNTKAFDRYVLMPQQLHDVREISLSIRLLGVDIAMPLLLAPTGMSRMMHHHREIAVARAAAEAGAFYSLSTLSSSSIEDVAAASTGPKIFQLYMMRDRDLTLEFVTRARESGYQALCVTVDTAIGGNRERDLRLGMTTPPRLALSTLHSFVRSWRWTMHYFMDPKFPLANIEHRADVFKDGAIRPTDYVNSQLDRSITWDDMAWLASKWSGPLIIKGLLSPKDAKRAVEVGASAIMISNHGGRQLDHTPAPIDCVAPMRDAVGDALELIVDGGIRRGTHVLTALALGANACSIGRPYLYGLAAGGEAGVTHALTLLYREMDRAMRLLGKTDVKQISAEDVLTLG